MQREKIRPSHHPPKQDNEVKLVITSLLDATFFSQFCLILNCKGSGPSSFCLRQKWGLEGYEGERCVSSLPSPTKRAHSCTLNKMHQGLDGQGLGENKEVVFLGKILNSEALCICIYSHLSKRWDGQRTGNRFPGIMAPWPNSLRAVYLDNLSELVHLGEWQLTLIGKADTTLLVLRSGRSKGNLV